jgi:hypothetical protein
MLDEDVTLTQLLMHFTRTHENINRLAEHHVQRIISARARQPLHVHSSA